MAQWSTDGAALYLRGDGLPLAVWRLELATGRKEPWRELAPPDRDGLLGLLSFVMTPDGGAYAYSYGQGLSQLYLME